MEYKHMQKHNKINYSYLDHSVQIMQAAKDTVITIDNNCWTFPSMPVEKAKKIVKEFIDNMHSAECGYVLPNIEDVTDVINYINSNSNQ